ncbi:MAG: glycosyltransferase, partial [Chloroflexota bacterium]|nr:glycosyltransferase [Chloroflexota bacterium]
WVSRYTPEKGAAEIIELAQKMRVGVDLYGDLEIISNPGYAQTCLSRADGMFARVSGGISREQVVDVLSTHVGLLQWSNWLEPFSLIVPEAMACGCPVIANRRGAAPELIVHGVTGFIVDSLDEMAQLIARGEVKKLNPEQMRKHVESKFGLPVFVNAWEKLLLEVVAGARW